MTPDFHLPYDAIAANGSPSQRQTWLDTIFVWFGLIIYAGSIITPLRILRGAAPLQPGESETVMAACQFLILGILICVVAARWQRILPLFRFMVPYLLIIGLCIASVLWSDYPIATVRRSITLAVCVIFGVYCYDSFGLARLTSIVSAIAIFLGALSIFISLIVPSIGYDPTTEDKDAMRGVFSQKNGLADFMLLGIACRCYQVIQDRRMPRFLGAVALLYLCIFFSRSVSSLLISTLVLVVVIWLLLLGRPRARLVFAFVAISLFIILFFGSLFLPDEIFLALGRDESLSGRVPLWEGVLATIGDRPLLGYGYSGFWNADSVDVQYLWQRAGWPAPDSHNGYLDILLHIGVVGLALYGWLWTRIIRLGILAQKAGTLPAATWILLFMLINALVNLAEGPLPWANAFTAMAPPALLSVSVWEQKRQRAASAGRMSDCRSKPGLALDAMLPPLPGGSGNGQ